MPISVIHEPEHGQLVLCVGKHLLLPEQRLDQIVDGLFEALEFIRARLPDRERLYFGLDVAGTHQIGSEFEPATVEAAKVWGKLASERRLHERLKDWLDELESLHAYAKGLNNQSDLWESDYWPLGAIAGIMLAAADLTFVRSYARIVGHFDSEHSVQTDHMLDEIIEVHGYCPEIEDLLIAWAIDGEKSGYFQSLLPQLEQHYGDFLASEFFRRMVEAQFRKERKDRQEWQPKYPGDTYKSDVIFGHKELDERATSIIAELQARGEGLPRN